MYLNERKGCIVFVLEELVVMPKSKCKINWRVGLDKTFDLNLQRVYAKTVYLFGLK